MPATGDSSMERRRERLPLGEAPDGLVLTVRRPEPLRSLLMVLSDLEKISERVAEDRSQDLDSGIAAAGGKQGGGALAEPSMRQKTIESLPQVSVMQRKLSRHLAAEARQLESRGRRISRRATRGSACLLNGIYARIRKLQGLIGDLKNATADIVRRLYIRLFVDHQQLV